MAREKSDSTPYLILAAWLGSTGLFVVSCRVVFGAWVIPLDLDRIFFTLFLLLAAGAFPGLVLTALISGRPGVLTIWRREILGYVNSPLAYLFAIVFLLLASFYFLFYKGDFFALGRADLRSFFEVVPWLYTFMLPAFTMRLWAEERRLGSIELLMTLPIRPLEIMLGKYLAAWSFLAATLALSLPLPFLVGTVGDLDWGPVLAGYLAALLLGGAFLAVGIFLSGLTRNQIHAYIFTFFVCLVLTAAGIQGLLESADAFSEKLGSVLAYVAVLPHYERMLKGVLDSKALVYFLSLVVLFLTFNRITLETYRF